MTDEQGLALARLMRDRPMALVTIRKGTFDLPADYVLVNFSNEFECGIAPEGQVSS